MDLSDMKTNVGKYVRISFTSDTFMFHKYSHVASQQNADIK